MCLNSVSKIDALQLEKYCKVEIRDTVNNNQG